MLDLQLSVTPVRFRALINQGDHQHIFLQWYRDNFVDCLLFLNSVYAHVSAFTTNL